MEIPGIAAKHCIITDDCRKLRTTEGAIDEALRIIKESYMEIMKHRGHQKGVSYKVVLVVDPPAKGGIVSNKEYKCNGCDYECNPDMAAEACPDACPEDKSNAD